MNVSSLVVRVSPENIELALAELKGAGLCDVHAHDREKAAIVVTIEGKDVGEEMDKMREIEKLPHVMGAALVYAAGEAELDADIAKIKGRRVPEVLKEE